MTLKNKEFRDTVRAAIKAHDRFSDFGSFKLWEKRVDSSDLPAISLGVPRWGLDPNHSLDTSERVATLVVAVKRCGGDELEDLGEEDAKALEDIVLGALDDEAHEVTPQEASYQEDVGGQQAVSTLSMMFAIKYWPSTS